MTLDEYKKQLNLDDDSHHDIKYFDENIALYYLIKNYFSKGMEISLYECNTKNCKCFYKIHPMDKEYDLSFMIEVFKDIRMSLYAKKYSVHCYMDNEDIIIELLGDRIDK